MYTILQQLRHLPRGQTLRTLVTYLLVFSVYYVGGRFGLYLFADLHSSPALIWPPVGIALAATFLWGYSMLVPLCIAQLLVAYSAGLPMLVVVVSAAGYMLQAALGAYLLRSANLRPQFDRTIDAVVVIGVSFFITTVGPSIFTMTLILSNTLSASALLTWTRSWGGGFSSAVVIVPFLVSWYHASTVSYSFSKKMEIVVSFLLLAVADYLIFWTTYTQYLGISAIFIIPVLLAWFTLRLEPRWFTLSVLLTAAMSLAGSLVGYSTQEALDVRLFSDELYIAFSAAIFLLFTVIVQERRTAFETMKEYTNELTNALEQISQNDMAKTEFIAILAHELRNPLAPVVSAHEWLRLQPQSRESLEAIESAQKHTFVIRRLLDDLLDIVRVTQKKFTLKLEPVTVDEVISQSVESAAGFFQSRNHRIVITPKHTSLVVLGDPIRLTQILTNLLTNAGKFMDPGGTVEITVEQVDERARINVRDNGIGISAEALQNIFDPFTRVEPKTDVGTGLGIGLSLTKQLVGMHGGSIEAYSEGVGKGSLFTIYLPLTTLRPGVAQVEDTSFTQVTHAMRILIVDDNEAASLGLTKLLRHKGFDVRFVGTGLAALGEVTKFSPEVVLLDIGLPDISGYEVASRLRADGFGGMVVALSGFGKDTSQNKADTANFDHYLVKPVSLADVLAVLPTQKS